ncbi:MAG TPA: CBS and ACT domain-containing protein [Chloroflexota bacterium]
MTRSVMTTEPHHTLQSAAHLMRDGRFRHLPVVRDGHLLGIISDRDVERPDCRTVAVVMHADVIAVNPDTPIEVAARLMLDNKIGALPVVEQGTDSLVGIVSQTDLFSVLARLLSGDGPNTRLELHLIDLPRQLATISALADQRHVHIISLVTLPADAASPDRRTVVLRIGTMIARPFVQALRQANIDVDLPEQPDA